MVALARPVSEPASDAEPSLTPALERMRRVAATVAAVHADDVDSRARFPAETFAALKEARLLGVMIPAELGGEGLGLAEVAELVAVLAGACGASGMIYAMHQIKVSSFVAHGRDSLWHRAYMARIADEQLLIGSATTEAGIGGDLRNSICAVETDGDRFRLVKQATVISYARHCDAILATARRAPDAVSSDQVMAVLPRDTFTLEQTHGWDTLGMRGTCSEGFVLAAEGAVAQIFPLAFSEIAAQSMLAMAHILWTATWFGIAADAFDRAQSFVRAEARRRPGTVPPGALRLAETAVTLQAMKAGLVAAVGAFTAAEAHPDHLSSMGFAAAMNALKVASAEMAPAIVQHALLVTGIAGYRATGPHAVGRHLRDVLSAAIMINNDRILANSANMLLVSRFDTTLVPR
jgi:acyl-CoA dehydrogenase